MTASAEDLPQVSIRVGAYGPSRLACPVCRGDVTSIEGLSTADVAEVDGDTVFTPVRPMTLGPCGHLASALTVVPARTP